MSDAPKKPDTGPLRKQAAQIQEMLTFLEETLAGAGVAQFVIDRDRLTAVAALVDRRLQDAIGYITDADVVVAIATGAGFKKSQSGDALIRNISAAIEQLYAATHAPDPSIFRRDDLGRLVWQSRVDYCIETDQTAGGVTPWGDLDEWTQESCKRTGEDLVTYILAVLENFSQTQPPEHDISNDDTGEQKKVERP